MLRCLGKHKGEVTDRLVVMIYRSLAKRELVHYLVLVWMDLWHHWRLVLFMLILLRRCWDGQRLMLSIKLSLWWILFLFQLANLTIVNLHDSRHLWNFVFTAWFSLKHESKLTHNRLNRTQARSVASNCHNQYNTASLADRMGTFLLLIPNQRAYLYVQLMALLGLFPTAWCGDRNSNPRQ